MADILGISVSTICSRASRNFNYSTDEINKICKALEIPPSYIYGESNISCGSIKNVHQIRGYLALMKKQIEMIEEFLEK